jgi:predicted dehydrogenase
MALRIGLIGCGGIARAHWRGWQVLQQQGKVKVVALADPSPACVEWFRKETGCPLGVADFQEMYEKAELDAVDICLPHHLHCDAVMAATQRKIHWLCEKPLCMTLDEAKKIDVAMEASPGLVGMSAHNQVFAPAVAEARKLLLDGLLGRIYTIISQDCFILGGPPLGSIPGTIVPSPIQPGSWRASRATMGGGELIDTGYHPSYRLLFLAGAEPVSVAAVLGRYRHEQLEGEDTATVLTQFDSGVTGLVRTSWAMELPYGHYQIHVTGERGQLFGTGGDLHFRPSRAKEPCHYALPQVDTFAAEVNHFVECIEQRKQPIQSYKDGIAVLRMIRRAYDSAGAAQPTAAAKP